MRPDLALWLASLFASAACSSHGAVPEAAPHPTSVSPSKVPPSNETTSISENSRPAQGTLTRTSTDSTVATLKIKNELRVPQFLFVDFVQVAVIPGHSSLRVALSDGAHTITCSDSSDPDHGGVSLSETFSSNYGYEYALRERSPEPQ